MWSLLYTVGWDEEDGCLGGRNLGEYRTYADVMSAYYAHAALPLDQMYGPGELVVTSPCHEKLPTPITDKQYSWN